MPSQIEYLERRVARTLEANGPDAQSTKLAMQQLDAHKAREEQRATGNYPANPVEFSVGGMRKPQT